MKDYRLLFNRIFEDIPKFFNIYILLEAKRQNKK